jgi:hypothetical protein
MKPGSAVPHTIVGAAPAPFEIQMPKKLVDGVDEVVAAASSLKSPTAQRHFGRRAV